MARRRRPRKGDVEVSQEEQWQQHRGRCRGPAQWANYSDSELNKMHEKARQLGGGGYETDQQYLLLLYKQK